MSATSAFSASRRRATSSTRSRSAATATRTPRSARSSAAASARTRSPTPSRRWSTPISACARDRDETFLDAYRRLGEAPFKEALYGWRSQGRLTRRRRGARRDAASLDALYGHLDAAGDHRAAVARRTVARRASPSCRPSAPIRPCCCTWSPRSTARCRCSSSTPASISPRRWTIATRWPPISA